MRRHGSAIIGLVLARLLLAMTMVVVLPACSAPSSRSGSTSVTQPKQTKATPTRIREPVDKVGYTHSAAGIEKVVAHAKRLEAGQLASRKKELGLTPRTVFSGGISPHDDYQYAQRVYVHLREWRALC